MALPLFRARSSTLLSVAPAPKPIVAPLPMAPRPIAPPVAPKPAPLMMVRVAPASPPPSVAAPPLPSVSPLPMRITGAPNSSIALMSVAPKPAAIVSAAPSAPMASAPVQLDAPPLLAPFVAAMPSAPSAPVRLDAPPLLAPFVAAMPSAPSAPSAPSNASSGSSMASASSDTGGRAPVESPPFVSDAATNAPTVQAAAKAAPPWGWIMGGLAALVAVGGVTWLVKKG